MNLAFWGSALALSTFLIRRQETAAAFYFYDDIRTTTATTKEYSTQKKWRVPCRSILPEPHGWHKPSFINTSQPFRRGQREKPSLFLV